MSDLVDRLLDWWIARRRIARWYTGISTLEGAEPPAILRMSCYKADLDVKLSLLDTGRLHRYPE